MIENDERDVLNPGESIALRDAGNLLLMTVFLFPRGHVKGSMKASANGLEQDVSLRWRVWISISTTDFRQSQIHHRLHLSSIPDSVTCFPDRYKFNFFKSIWKYSNIYLLQ